MWALGAYLCIVLGWGVGLVFWGRRIWFELGCRQLGCRQTDVDDWLDFGSCCGEGELDCFFEVAVTG